MPLMIEGKHMGVPPTCMTEFIERYPHFKGSASFLAAQKCRTIVPSQLLYVGQREMAAVSADDTQICYLGSDDATTCHIVILRHTGSGAVCLSHMDGCGTKNAIRKMIDMVKKLSEDKLPGRYELHLVGGFKDPKGASLKLSIDILTGFNNLSDEIHLQLACITDLNDTTKGGVHFPIVYGAAINMKSGEIQKADFPEHGPDEPVRTARHFTGSEEVINIYDYEKEILQIGPFNYSTMDEIDLLCRLPDQFIRENLSTSPEQEPKHFESKVRAGLVQIRDHPKPLETIFKGGRPKCYKLVNGNWGCCD